MNIEDFREYCLSLPGDGKRSQHISLQRCRKMVLLRGHRRIRFLQPEMRPYGSRGA